MEYLVIREIDLYKALSKEEFDLLGKLLKRIQEYRQQVGLKSCRYCVIEESAPYIAQVQKILCLYEEAIQKIEELSEPNDVFMKWLLEILMEVNASEQQETEVEKATQSIEGGKNGEERIFGNGIGTLEA